MLSWQVADVKTKQNKQAARLSGTPPFVCSKVCVFRASSVQTFYQERHLSDLARLPPVCLTFTVRMKSQKRKRKREFKTRRSGSGFLLNPGLRWLKQAILTAGALVSFGRWIVVFYLGFLPPDCLDTHGLFASWASRSKATTTKRL